MDSGCRWCAGRLLLTQTRTAVMANTHRPWERCYGLLRSKPVRSAAVSHATAPPPPPPVTTAILYLDYNPARITRIGRSQGPWGAGSITGVTNKSGYALDLGLLAGNANTVLVADVLAAGATSSNFNAYHPTQNCVGTVLSNIQPDRAVGPIEIHY